MNNIDLASFNIDLEPLFKKLVQTRAEIDKVKASQKQLRDEFTNANKSVADNQKTVDQLNAKLSTLTKGTATYNETLAQRDKAEKNLNESTQKQLQINQNYQASLTASQLELNKLNSQARSYQSILDAQNRSTNDSITLYERQRAELSLLQKEQRELGAQLEQAKASGNKEAIEQLSSAYTEASEKANELAVSLRGIDTAGGNFTSNIGNYKSALEDFKGALLSGDYDGLKESFNGITGSIKGMITQSLAFIATPIGAAITALVGIGAAAKAVFDFNEGIKESNTLLKGLGVSSGEISKVRTELEATAETYGKSFEELAKTADSLATSYGISISEANDIISKGLAQGGAANEDFLNQISEYDVQFQQLGFTAEESLAAINAGFAEGVYNDKLPDALKELGLSLAEGTKASADALTNAFGQTFSDTLLNGVSSGTITVKDALQQIGDKSKEVGLNLQQQQQLTADVFRGAGEDAGGALKIIEILNTAQTRQLTEAEKAVEDLRLANERLNQAQAQLFEIKDFGSVWAGIKAQAINFFVDVIDYLAELKDDLQPVIDLIGIVLVNAWNTLKTTVSIVFDSLKSSFKTIGIVISGFVNFFKKIFSGDFRGAINVVSETFTRLLQNVQNTFNKIRNAIINGLKGILSNMKPILEAVGVDVDKLSKKLDGLKGKVVETKTKAKEITGVETTIETKNKGNDKLTGDRKVAEDKRIADAQKAREEAQKKLEEQQKREIDSAQKLADEKIKLANVELNAYIEKNKSILDNEKFLTAELLKQENERLKNIEKAKLEQEKLEYDTQNTKLQAQIDALAKKGQLNKAEKNELETLRLQQKQLETQYNSDVVKIKEDTQKQITANETRYSNERIEADKVRRAIQYQTEILDLEAKGATEQEIKLAQQEQTYQLELEKYAQKLADEFQIKLDTDANNQVTQDEINLAREQLEAELQSTKDENEKIRIQNQLNELTNLERVNSDKKKQITEEETKSKLNAYNRLFGDIRGLFGQETAVAKAAGIAQAGINTYLGATAVLADKTVPTFIKPVLVATTIASGLQSVAKIVGIKGFAEGGLINGGVEISRSNGDNRLITAKDGEVILNESQQKALGGSAIFKSIGVPGFATGGVVGSPISSLSNIQNEFTNTLNNELLAETLKSAVMEGAMSGTATGSQRGISDLQTNNYIASTANF